MPIKEAQLLILMGSRLESIHKVWAAIDYFEKAFTEMFGERFPNGQALKVATTAGSAFLNACLFCSQVGLVKPICEKSLKRILYSTIGLFALDWNIKNHKPATDLEQILNFLPPTVYSWSADDCPVKFLLKVRSNENIDHANMEFGIAKLMHSSMSLDCLLLGSYREKLDTFYIDVFPGFVGKAFRRQQRLPDDQKVLFSYIGYNRQAKTDEQIDAYFNFSRLVNSDIGKNQISLQRQINWMWPRTILPLGQFSAKDNIINVYLQSKGKPFSEILTEYSNSVYLQDLRKIGLDAIAGLHSSMNLNWPRVSSDLKIRHYDYSSKLHKTLSNLKIYPAIANEFQSVLCKTLEKAKRIIVHGDSKPDNLIIPWSLSSISIDQYLSDNLQSVLADKPGEPFMLSPEISQSIIIFSGESEKPICPAFHSYLYPCFVDLESVCFAPLEHDLVRLIDDPPNTVSETERNDLLLRYTQRMNDIQTRTGLDPPVIKTNRSIYDSILIVRILDRMCECIRRGGNLSVCNTELNLSYFIHFLQQTINSDSSFIKQNSSLLNSLLACIRSKYN